MWNKIILKQFQCLIWHVTTDGAWLHAKCNTEIISKNFKCFNWHLTTYVIISKLFQPQKLFQNNFTDIARLKIFKSCNKPLKSFWNNFGQKYFSRDIAQLIFCCIVISIFLISLIFCTGFMSWLHVKQEALLMQRNRASTLSFEIV